MYKLLITGHTGFLGKYLSELAISQHKQVIGLSRTASEIQGLINIPSDLSEMTSFDFLEPYAIQGIVHLAANSSLNDCEKNVTQSTQINVKSSVQLAAYAKKKHIPFVFASTDQVFDGEQGNYSPKDEAKPLNQYGLQKLQAEKEILTLYPEAAICRLPLMIGSSGGYEKALVENLRAGKEQTLFTDEIRSPAKVEAVANQLLKALAWTGGIYHLGGPKAMNRYEIAVQIAEANGLDKRLLNKGLQGDVQMPAKRPKDVSLTHSSL